MQAHYLKDTASEALLDPLGAAWSGTSAETLNLIGVPLGLQPTPMIRNSWEGKAIGAVKEVAVAALHNGSHLVFHLSWSDPSEDRVIEDNDQFADGAAIFLPTTDDTALMTMGSSGNEANMWYWRADQATGRHVVAAGVGTTRTIDETNIIVNSIWKEGQWQVVIARVLQLPSSEPVIQLAGGDTISFSVAIWEGSQGERAGIKSFSPQYTALSLDPTGE